MLRPILCALALLCGSGCSEEQPDRGLRYMPDMYDSPSYKSQEAMVLTERGLDGALQTRHVPAMQTPPAGTIARGDRPYTIAAEDLARADQQPNPLPADAATLRLGRDKYAIFCAVCHGKEGNADYGYVKNQLVGIPSLNTTTVASYADGRIFHWITLGRGRMPNYRAQLRPQERWAVIHYLRSLQQAPKLEARKLPDDGSPFEPLPAPQPEYASEEVRP